MRLIVLDTETTGLSPQDGHRVIEVGCVELIDRRLTGNNYHRYINPQRDSDEGALRVHGLTSEFLSQHPVFENIADELMDYLRGADILIHNAPFDMGFLDAELKRLGQPLFKAQVGKVTDSLVLAKELHPGKRNSLDALCERYDISNSHRKLHGALLDAELLADVYMAMTRGQSSLGVDAMMEGDLVELQFDASRLPVLSATADELTDHEKVLDAIAKESRGVPVWRRIVEADKAA
ncbi:DNA polymerase III subunit epsilon [Ampullimonas aquatilis]|uniref:DNA polymerase III subunit epsilon n=1 Tax=Ampullimonas aquatilis TaxID=1341549 RepID=UPI003C75CB1F